VREPRRPETTVPATVRRSVAVVVAVAACVGIVAVTWAGTSSSLGRDRSSIAVLVAPDAPNAVMADRHGTADRVAALVALLVGATLLTHSLLVVGLASNGSRPFRAGRSRRPLGRSPPAFL
jgi:hypothetical protein